MKQDIHDLGAIEVKTMFGHTVRCYCQERTVVDLIRSRSRVDQQEMISALKGYVRSQNRDIPLLLRYARAFSVERALETYLEVLL